MGPFVASAPPLFTAPGGTEWLALALAYLLGAVPFGLVLVRLFKGVDLRQVGSGNIGATNAMRAAGRPVGLAVFALDFGKGWASAGPIALGFAREPAGAHSLQVLCGAAAVLGHCFPLYLRFRGGKGVATACGALVAIDPAIFVIGGLVWLAVLLATRYAGLASIAMGIAFPAAAWFRFGRERAEVVVGAGLLTLLILVRHRSNMARMLDGTEPKVLTRKTR